MTLLVEKAALFMSVQDRGRTGYQRFGMPESGPMDWWAFKSANHLVGNKPNCACVEIGFSSAEMVIESNTLMAVCGAGYRLVLNDRAIPLWMAFLARKGDRMRIDKTFGGNWAYLGVFGGIQSDSWMGSRSIYVRAGLGRKLMGGDQLPLVSFTDPSSLLAGSSMPISAQPIYSQEPVIGIIPGPHQHQFTARSIEVFWDQPYTVSTKSDRMGYRMTGASLSHRGGADIISQGMVLGEVQVPADGQPIVMMPDHPTTGGYTCIGTVARVDLPLLAQAQPGQTQLYFRPIEVNAAQKSLADVIDTLESSISEQEDTWLNL